MLSIIPVTWTCKHVILSNKRDVFDEKVTTYTEYIEDKRWTCMFGCHDMDGEVPEGWGEGWGVRCEAEKYLLSPIAIKDSGRPKSLLVD